MAKFCTKCGAQIADGSKFCVFCGQAVALVAAAAPAAAPMAQAFVPPAAVPVPAPQQPFQQAPQPQFQAPPQPQPYQQQPQYAQPYQQQPQFGQPQQPPYGQPQQSPYGQPQPQPFGQPQQPPFGQQQQPPYGQPQQPPYGQPQYGQQQQQDQYMQQLQRQMQSGGAEFIDKATVLRNAPAALNRPNQPWYVSVEGNNIVGRWNVQNPEFFNPMDISDDTKLFTFTVILSDKGTWKESDEVKETSKGVSFSGGQLSFGSSSNSFKGKTNQKSFEFGLGKKPDGSVGIVGSKFDTTMVKEPIRRYLISCGWKKGK